MVTGMRGVLEALPPGTGDGVFGVAAIIESTDSGKTLDLITKTIQFTLEMLADVANEQGDTELAQVHAAISYTARAEQIAGVSVSHLKIDPAKTDWLDEEDIEELLPVMGKDGMLFRMAPADASRLVIGFGGGAARMKSLIEHAKKNQAPLDHDAGIKKVAPRLPKERASVLYLAVDQILVGVREALKAMDEEAPPVHMPDLNAPLAMAASGGDGAIQFDLFAPTELLRAVKDAALMLMSTMSPPPGQPGHPSPPPGQG